MLVLAPAACILSGIALSEAFTVLTRSIKFQLSLSLEVRVLFYYCEMLLTFSVTNVCTGQLVTSAVFYAYSGLTFDIPSEGCFNSQSEVVPNELKDESKATLLEKDKEPLREKSSKKNGKKEKENVEKVSDKKEHKKRSLLLPLEASAVGILLLIVLGSFYVVC
jgi:dolichyl-diphosphooligosaccharide--protein glycosyltransferase